MTSLNAQHLSHALPADGEDLRQRLQDRLRLLEELDELHRFETLLGDLSATFVNLSPCEVDTQIESALERIVGFLGIDRGGLAELLVDQKQLVITHLYHVPGVPLLPRIIVNEQLPWYARAIQQGKVLRLSALPDDLPPEAASERAYCIQVGLKAHLMIPLKVMDSVVGAIGFGSFRRCRDWPDDLIQRLRLVGEIFANALARKRDEERVQQLRDQLTRVARMTTMGELAATITHEVNQPLCAIVSNAQAAQRLLAGGAPDLDEARETLLDIVADGQRASEVIGRIRSLFQKRRPERAPLDLNSAVREVVVLLRHKLSRESIALSLDLATDLPPVLADRVQLQQVLVNLLLNAVEALAAIDVQPRELSIRSARAGAASVEVAVCDCGPGIAPEHAERIFDALFTTKPGGMGIGLAISRSIVQAHGGRIWAEPNAGCGAAFHFTLPAAEGTTP
jgi:signal transduction histidine kinase